MVAKVAVVAFQCSPGIVYLSQVDLSYQHFIPLHILRLLLSFLTQVTKVESGVDVHLLWCHLRYFISFSISFLAYKLSLLSSW